jgi:hypothetical protein
MWVSSLGREKCETLAVSRLHLSLLGNFRPTHTRLVGAVVLTNVVLENWRACAKWLKAHSIS